MSLNISVDYIEEESLRYNDDHTEIGAMAKNIGFWSLAVEIGKLDHKTADEWYARYEILRKLGVNFFFKDGKPYEITYNDLRNHLGLSTNVRTTTRRQWLWNQISGRMDDSIRDRKRAGVL